MTSSGFGYLMCCANLNYQVYRCAVCLTQRLCWLFRFYFVHCKRRIAIATTWYTMQDFGIQKADYLTVMQKLRSLFALQIMQKNSCK